VIEDMSTMLSWPLWFESVRTPMPRLNGPRYSDPSLAFDAAIAGHGVLMMVDRMSEDAVRAGQLIRPFATVTETSFDYWFITSTARRVPRKVQLFRDWVFGEMGA
jgi:DNA-binding transcriptional LysR family regulator